MRWRRLLLCSNVSLPFIVCLSCLVLKSLAEGPVLMTSSDFRRGFIEDPETGALVSVQGAFSWFFCDLLLQTDMERLLTCPEYWILHLNSPLLSLSIAYVGDDGRPQSAPDDLHGDVKIVALDEETSTEMAVQSLAETDIQIQHLDASMDIEMDFTEIAVPVVMLSATIGNWTRNITVEHDVVPPTVVSLQQITDFTEGDAPMGQVLIEFSEPVFPISDTLFCTAPLSSLSKEYSALDMIRDSSRFCGQDVTSRPFDAAIRVTGAQSHHAHSLMNNGTHYVLLEIFPFSDTASKIGIFVEKGTIADYAGNLLQEERRQFLQYEPPIQTRKRHQRHRHKREDPPGQATEEASSDLSACRKTGVIFSSLAAASIFSALLTSVRSSGGEGVDRISACREMLGQVIPSIFLFQEFVRPFQWLLFHLSLPWGDNACV